MKKRDISPAALFGFGISQRAKDRENLRIERIEAMDSEIQIMGTNMTILLPPELDHPNADRIREKTDSIIRERYIKTITFDFKDTVFMDSSGIGLLMGRYKALGLRGGSIYAAHVNNHIFKILHLSGVYRFLEIQKEEPESGESEEGRELWKTPMK